MATNKTTGSKTATKKTASAPVEKKTNNEIAELKKTVEALTAQNEMLMKMFLESQKSAAPIAVMESASTNSLNDEVTLVHLIENAPGLTTHIELSNITMDLSAFGEERTLDRRQAEEISGKYRKWFDKGIIAFGANGDELASKFGLKSVNDYSYINKNFVKQLGSLSLLELENLYKKVGDGHKKFIISYFKRKIVEGDPAFKDVHKIEMLNRVSGGAMSGTTLDLQREAEVEAKNN